GLRTIVLTAVVGQLASLTLAEPPTQKSKAVTIPLDTIWATDMPGTREIAELAKEHQRLTQTYSWETLLRSFSDERWNPKITGRARDMFVVPGEGLDALLEADAVLRHKKKAQST